ncbi:peptide MFS transporter [Francisella sp. Scap27]|uniref:MFS transporter n=1 Tax=Francisella sp. Scap27 TaxID=2589986 RepID=UPI0015BC7CC6|nr:MFS transporter [Francisella sp. Scap27]QLE79829.1 peptide MFS transporter [Francisella sp. Scap27]
MINYKEMPKGVLQINIIQIFSTVGYAVLMGLLNFYLTDHGGFTKTEANTLTASFFALNFLLHFLGGALGGKFFSFRGLFLISVALQVVSMFMIAEHHQTIIIYGMALFITGAGLNVSCLNMMLTQLFKSKDRNRRVAFSINYSCMNIGFAGSFLLSGIIQSYGAYTIAFYTAAGCLAFSIVLHLFNFKNVEDKDTYFHNQFSKSIARYFSAPAVILACFIFSIFLIKNPEYGSFLVISVFVMIIIYLVYTALKQTPEYRERIFAFMILSSACMVFAFVQGMQSSALENFVEFNTNKSLFGITMQPATVNIFETLGVIVFGFLLAIFAKRRLENGTTLAPGSLITRGIGLYIVAFLMIPLGIMLANKDTGTVNVIFPILLLVIVAAGEIHVNATSYALVGDLIKPIHQGMFTGYLFVNVAVGIIISGPVSNYAIGNEISAKHITALGTNPMYSNIFISLAVIAIVLTIIFFLISKKINSVFKRLHTT